jgi:hypothetical protein
MVAFNKFNVFVEDVGRKVHNLHTDTLKIMLANVAPVATNAVKADLTEIGAGNGYSAGGATPANRSYAQTSGVGKLAMDDVSFTASGGTIGPFRYIVLYNDTPTSPADPLIGWWDRGASLTLQDGEVYTPDLTDNTAAITLT